MADADFQKQLELEEAEKKRNEARDSGNDPYTYTDPNDGTVYEWNAEKQAWFPKVDDEFIARYQNSNYNYQNPEEEETAAAVPAEQETTLPQKRKAAAPPAWFNVDDDHNTNVYVSGLPDSTTEEEFVELMSKCGLVMKDPATMKYKVKLYKDPSGHLKGDGRCCYIKIESVKLALDILDGYNYKGKTIHVERAQFELKGQYDPTKKPKKKKPKEKEKLKKKMEKLFDWRPEKLRGQRSRNENTVIIKNMFEPKEFDEDATLLLDYQKDIREECSKCGEVKRVVIYDRNPEGVVAVTFSEPEMADECITLMNGRWFASRQLAAETWDGKTKYKIIETEEELKKRLNSWDSYLAEGKEREESSSATSNASTQRSEALSAAGSSSSSSANEGASNELNVRSSTHQTGVAPSSSEGNGRLNVSNNTYEQAGDTGSSGDSDG